MSNKNLIGSWVQRFLQEYIVNERNFSPNTQASYCDALRLLLPYVSKKAGKPVDRLFIEDISSDVVRKFLLHLERDRGCSIATRNVRLAAIHSLSRFIGQRSPIHIAWCTEIQTITPKKTFSSGVTYLEKSEMDALLGTPDRSTPQGYRDYALLLFLYNTGARADESARLTIANLDLGNSAFAKFVGKGRKVRIVPLWTSTVGILQSLTGGRDPGERVFLNRLKQPMTRFGVYSLVDRYVRKVGGQYPSLLKNRVSPHIIRHTTATHLYRAGVDINTIRAWLGHVSLDTTNIYVEVDLEMKAKALAHCEIPSPSGENKNHWRNNKGLMTFLKSLQSKPVPATSGISLDAGAVVSKVNGRSFQQSD
jgi:site-specific recombinase XerD